jgi:hypothetical protein
MLEHTLTEQEAEQIKKDAELIQEFLSSKILTLERFASIRRVNNKSLTKDEYEMLEQYMKTHLTNWQDWENARNKFLTGKNI